MKKILSDWLLLALSIILFMLAHPSIVVLEGLPFLAYFSLVPLFLLVARVRFSLVWLYGLIYGTMCYATYGYWLADFHPLGLPVIMGLYGLQCMFLLPLLKLVSVLCGKHAWIVQWAVWCAYEYVKTLGFPGFSYGIMGYTHWQVLPLLQFASIAGVWGLGALITFTSAWLGKVLLPLFEINGDPIQKGLRISTIKKQCVAHKISAFVWLGCFILVFVYGIVVQKDYSTYEQKTVALIQANSDPWKGGTTAYSRDLNTLKRLTNEALSESDEIDFVVWSETAFVPSIRMHYQYREDRVRLELINDLLSFIDSKNVPFVIGNGDTQRGYNQSGDYTNISYNSVFLFRPGINVIPPNPEIYNKMHLVPFTEHFPYEEQFPFIHQALIDNDTHFWAYGDEANVFTIDNLTFGTPICFEDTFGYISRQFAHNGAQAIVNLTNDSWSHSAVAQYQHLSMAVFRSVENRLPSLRATASGQTSIIDPNGKVTAMAEPFTETYLVGAFPVVEKEVNTLYTMCGDFIGIVFIVLSSIALLVGIVVFAWKRIKR